MHTEQAAIVVIGSGQGGFQLAASLREQGHAGPLTLVGDEPGLPYQRPPLSKAYLLDHARHAPLELRPAVFYAQQGIAVMAPERAIGIDRSHRRVLLASGLSLPYQQLVLATGARPRMPGIPGSSLAGIAALRTRADADALLSQLSAARRIVILGAGFIGLEVAHAARERGLDVHVLESADRALKRAVSSQVADHLTDALMRRGVRFSFFTPAIGFTGANGHVAGVLTAASASVPADVVVVGIGVQANVELAQAAGLAVDDGIVVDGALQTSDPHIFAIGDCARFPGRDGGGPLRIESIQNAVDQARCVAARLCGKPAAYSKVPWFWSDQGPNRLQIAGVASADDVAVVRGDMASGRFSVFRFRHERLTAVESINSAAEHMAARKLLAAAHPISPQQAADPAIKLAPLTVSS